MKNIAITGHRPQKLYGYNLNTPQWEKIAYAIRQFLISVLAKSDSIHCLSGMALGTDQLFALVALNLKTKGYPIALTAVCPCYGLEKCWRDAATWRYIMDRADKVVYVHDGPFIPSCFELRDKYLLEHCDMLLAAYAGIAGGAARCIASAVNRGIPVYHLIAGTEVVTPVF